MQPREPIQIGVNLTLKFLYFFLTPSTRGLYFSINKDCSPRVAFQWLRTTLRTISCLFTISTDLFLHPFNRCITVSFFFRQRGHSQLSPLLLVLTLYAAVGNKRRKAFIQNWRCASAGTQLQTDSFVLDTCSKYLCCKYICFPQR